MRNFFIVLFIFFSNCTALFGQERGLQSFPLSAVRILEGPLKKAEQTDLKYIMAMDPDKLLAPYLLEAGLSPKAAGYGNWESSGLGGHIGGHYISALSNMYAATGDAKVLQRLNYMIDEIERCQQQNADGYVGGVPGGRALWKMISEGKINADNFSLNGKWVPWYNIHKLFAGLLDAWQISGSSKARDILIKLSDWSYQLTAGLSDAQMQQMLRCEHGGMNEVFAEVAGMTGDKKYLYLAERFSDKALLNPLLKQTDSLTGLHANTQIPKVIGFAAIAKAGSNKNWMDAAAFFWQTVVNNRSVSIGGNSVREHFHPAGNFSSMIETREGPETCNTYNMLKLSRRLFMDKPDIRYADYYERALYNHILSSQHPDGGFVYFTPMRPAHYRVYSQVDQGFWCCVGSGIENHSKYGEFIYAHDENDLYINLFIPSTLSWKKKGIQLEQQTAFPYEQGTTIRLTAGEASKFSLYIRYPGWVKEGLLKIKVNNKDIQVNKNEFGYIKIDRVWQAGDQVKLILPMHFQSELLPDKSPWMSLLFGPVVLAAAVGNNDLESLRADSSRMGHIAKGTLYPINEAPVMIMPDGSLNNSIRSVKGKPLHFTASKMIYPSKYSNLELKPFFELHDSRYMLYWRTADKAGFAKLKEELLQKEKEKLSLEAITIDQVAPGEQQPESDHVFKGQQTETGLHKDLHWRRSRDWFSYQLRDKNNAAKTLRITYYGNERNNGFDIYINDQLLKNVSLNGSLGDKFIDIDYSIPGYMLNTSGIVQVKFTSQQGAATARIFYVRLLSKEMAQ